MKKVFSNSYDLIHCFAQQSQEEGRSNNVFFEGKSLYSYGHYYEIARFVENKDGEKIVLFSTNRYSSSTGKHLNIARQALSHYNIVYIYQVNFSAEELIKHYTYEINDNLHHAAKAISKRDDFLSYAVTNYEEISAFFAIVFPKQYRKELSRLKRLVTNIDLTKVKKAIERQKLAEAKEKAYREKSIQEKISLWIAGKNDYIPNTDSVYLRVKNDRVETSLHAHVSLEKAKLLYSLIIAKRDIQGFKIDDYTVISFNEGILKIGCHNIPFSEIERISKYLQ